MGLVSYSDEQASRNEEARCEDSIALDRRAKLDAKLLRTFAKLQGLRKYAKDTQLCPVAPGLFIGSIGAAQNLQGLRAAGVTHILNASPLVPCFYRGNFQYLVLEVHDDSEEDITQYFSLSNCFIKQGLQEGGVLIHCFAGVSRSAAFTLAYIIANLGLGVADALSLLRCSRPTAQPNSGFMTQLQALYEMHKTKNLVAHTVSDVIDWRGRQEIDG